jgi:hypothetical protein
MSCRRPQNGWSKAVWDTGSPYKTTTSGFSGSTVVTNPPSSLLTTFTPSLSSPENQTSALGGICSVGE